MNGKRQLGSLTATALVIASMVGSGVFTTSGFLLGDLGSREVVLLAWLVGGVIAGLGALCYGALARRIPESGGEYVFLSRTLHPSAGYLAGWVSLLVGFSAPLAAAAYAFGAYASPWFQDLSPRVSGSVVILAFVVVHAFNVNRGAHLQNVTVILKVILILVFVGYGLGHLPSVAPPEPVSFDLATFGVSLVWISFSYSGWNAAVYIGGEVKDPERSLPRALLLGTGLVMALYLLLNAVFVYAAPVEELAGKLDVGRLAAEAIGGPMLGNAVAALICLALVTSVSSLTMAGPRIYAQMARDGYLPRWLSAGAGPPRSAIGLQACIALGLLWTAAYDSLLTYIGFTLMLGTAATVVGLIRLRRREGRGLQVPGWPWVPGLFLLCVFAMGVFSLWQRWFESTLVLSVLAFGWVVWRVQAQRLGRGEVDP